MAGFVRVLLMIGLGFRNAAVHMWDGSSACDIDLAPAATPGVGEETLILPKFCGKEG